MPTKPTITQYYSICGEITWPLVGTAIDEIYSNYIENKFNRLIVSISSPGGDLDSGWSLYSTLKNLGCKVTTVANGRVYSTATLIYLAGEDRVVFPDSVFLFHPSRVTINSEEEKEKFRLEEDLKAFSIDDKLYSEIIKNALTKASKKDINKLVSKYKTCFVDAKEAIKLNLATRLIKNFTEI